MKIIALTVFAWALSACCGTFDTGIRITGATLAVATINCDISQTADFLKNSYYHETNPILGKHPGSGYLWSYDTAVSAAIVVANFKLPRMWALILDGVVVGAEVYTINANRSIGVPVCGAGTPHPPKH